MFVCPQGDAPSLMAQAWWLSLKIVDLGSNPIADIPASDFWLLDCDPQLDLILCAGSASAAADSSTNNQGMTTMSNSAVKAGGCADGLTVAVQGFILEDETNNCNYYCFPVYVRSPDFDRSLTVGLPDLSLFAQHFPTPYEKWYDLNMDGITSVADVAIFAFHYYHQCQ